MNIQYTDLKGEYFFFGIERRNAFLLHPLNDLCTLRATVLDWKIDQSFEVIIHDQSYNSYIGNLKYDSLLIEDCPSFIKENVTRRLLLSPSSESFRNCVLAYNIDLTPLVKYYPALEKYVKPWYCEYDKHK